MISWILHFCKESYYLLSKLGNYISLLNFKIVVAKALIGRYSTRKRLFPSSRPSMWKSHEPFMPREVPTHIPEFQERKMRCYYCKNEGPDNRAFVSFQTCGLYLCLTKERNCLLKYCLYFSITITLVIICLFENKLFLRRLLGFFFS